MSQTAAILGHLQSGQSITALEALELCGCFRLAARIRDLRAAGHSIISVPMRTSSGKTVACYRLTRAK
jgi:hypothetical protein